MSNSKKPMVIEGPLALLVLAILLLLSPLVAVFSLFLLIFREPILQGKLFPRLRVFYLFSHFWPIFPGYPKGFGKNILDIPMNLDSAEYVYTDTMHHLYAGPYVLKLFTEQPPDFGTHKPDPYNTGAIITATFRINGGIIYTFTLNPNDYITPFWAWDKTGKKSGGLMLAKYLVPENLPQGAPIDCEFRIQLLNTNLKDKYKNVRLVIAPVSEE